MESALVRKDAVMLHEPMRHHLRATAVGLILGVLGLVAFFVVGKFSPTSQISSNEIDPRRLVSMRHGHGAAGPAQRRGIAAVHHCPDPGRATTWPSARR